MEQADLQIGIVIILFGLTMWAIVLWEKYFPKRDGRFPRKGNEKLYKWFEDERKKFKL